MFAIFHRQQMKCSQLLIQKNHIYMKKIKFTTQFCTLDLILRQLHLLKAMIFLKIFGIPSSHVRMDINHPCCQLMAHLKRKKINCFQSWAVILEISWALCWHTELWRNYLLFKYECQSITLRNQWKTNISLIDLIYTPEVLPLTACLWFQKQWLFSD